MKTIILRSIGVIGALSVFGLFGACSVDTEGGAPAGGGSGGSAGAGGSAGDGGPKCATITFDSPKTGANLTAADDKDKDACANGFQYDVTVSTSAADGVSATLFANNSMIDTADVSGGKVVFPNVTLDSSGATVLKVQIGAQACYSTSTVTVACGGGVSCSISKPVISPTHPALNGVPVSEGGDRASAAGNPYQVAFEVTTSAESGSTVTLEVDKKANAAQAQVGANGKAVFAGVQLTPDGDHTVKATCKATSGASGTSAESKYLVDTLAPNLTVEGLANDAVKTAADDVDTTIDGVQFEVCGTTTSADATDLASSLGAAQNNFCIKNGSAQSNCMPVLAGKACVKVDCNAIGSAAQTLTATLKDAAGNPKALSYANVKCQTGNPTVVIVDPVAYDPASSSPVILNKSKDADPAVYGLQYTVTACTNAPVGSMATLQQKAPGQPSAPIGAEVAVAAAQGSDNCPAGTTNVAKFAGVTLAESSELADGTLVEVTRLRADVVVAGTTFSSALTDEWVDTTLPGPFLVSVIDPGTLAQVACGGVVQSLVDVTTSLYAGCDAPVPIFARVTHQDSSVDSTGTVVGSGVLQIQGVKLKTGLNTIVIEANEPAGNTGTTAGCEITVGNPPELKFVNLSNSSLINLSSVDADPATPGYQSDVVLSSSDSVDPVTLTVQGQQFGSLVPTGGTVTFPNVTLPDADALSLKATQVATGGTASATVTFRVDTHAPSAALTPASSVVDRRAASANLTFKAPSDYDPVTQGERAAGAYEVRRLQVQSGADCAAQLTEANFTNATQVTAGGVPLAPGASDTRLVDSMTTGRSYCFGLRASDSAGNNGPLTVFPAIEPTWLNKTISNPSGATGKFGWAVLGGIDFDQDGYSDLAVSGDPNSVWIYYGSATGLEPNPRVQIKGPAGAYFGYHLADLGNFDGSSEAKPLPELAVGAPLANAQGAVYVFSLPADLHSQAMTTIEIDAAGAPVSGSIGAHFVIVTDGGAAYANARFGANVTNVGDFDGDGIPDVVVGASNYQSALGRAHLFRGRKTGTATLVAGPQSEIEFISSVVAGSLGVAIAPLAASGIPSLGGAGGVVIGIPTAGGTAGALHAFAGSPVAYGAHLVWDVASKATATVSGADGEYLGGNVWLLGDADGDGLDDFLATNLGPEGQSIGFLVYGGTPWGNMARINNDYSASADRLWLKGAARPLDLPSASRLGGDARSDAAFSSWKTNGVAAMTSWVVNGTPKLSGAQSLTSIGVRPPLPTGAGSTSSVSYAPGAAGNDTWPDIAIGDMSANSGAGRVIVIY